MIAVRDIRKSAAWYCKLLGATNDHARDDFDRIVDGDRVLLMLHHWGGGEHGAMRSPEDGTIGNGFLLWIYVSDLDAIYARAKKLKATVVTKPHDNPQAGWREFTVRDLDGYAVALAEA